MRHLFRSDSRPRSGSSQIGTIDVTLGDRVLSVTYRTNRRAKRYILRLDPRSGLPILTIPRGGSVRGAIKFVQDNTIWLAEKLAENQERVDIRVGTILPVRGAPHVVEHSGRLRGLDRIEMRQTGQALVMSGDPEAIAGRTIRYLKKLALDDYQSRVAVHAAALGRKPKRIRITDTRSRWGSCSVTGTISLSWRLILAPPEILDYLTAHEMSHLREMNHGPRFWELVEQLVPEFRQHSAWLKVNGSQLWLYG